jgi:hypothetical protein
MTIYRQAPTFDTPLQEGRHTTASWYRWIQLVDTGVPPQVETTIALTGSPFTYTAPAKGFLIVYGGSVSSITFTRVATYNTGQTQGTFPLSLGDKLVITYTGGGPTLTWVPQ